MEQRGIEPLTLDEKAAETRWDEVTTDDLRVVLTRKNRSAADLAAARAEWRRRFSCDPDGAMAPGATCTAVFRYLDTDATRTCVLERGHEGPHVDEVVRVAREGERSAGPAVQPAAVAQHHEERFHDELMALTALNGGALSPSARGVIAGWLDDLTRKAAQPAAVMAALVELVTVTRGTAGAHDPTSKIGAARERALRLIAADPGARKAFGSAFIADMGEP